MNLIDYGYWTRLTNSHYKEYLLPGHANRETIIKYGYNKEYIIEMIYYKHGSLIAIPVLYPPNMGDI